MNSISRPYIALSLTCLIWGTTYLVNKIGVSHIPAMLFATIRHLVAGIILLFYLFVIRKEKFPDKQFLLFQAVLGLLLLSIGNGIGVLGLKYIDSGLSAILAAASPIVISFLTHLYHPQDKIGKMAWLGILFGFIGLLIICSDKINLPFNFDNNFKGIFLTLISIMAWAIGSVFSKTKKFSNTPLMAAGFQMIFASIPLAAYCLMFEDYNSYRVDIKSIAIWLYVIVFGSLIAYSAYIYALKHLPAPIVSIQSYANPIIAVLLGYILLNEKLSSKIYFGGFITLIGIFLVNYFEYRRKKKSILKSI
ncbi:MAG: EamA family transporter [Saprospiraceae bacterium]|nr:EamA family transporter [Saprospiraceae bacterium]